MRPPAESWPTQSLAALITSGAFAALIVERSPPMVPAPLTPNCFWTTENFTPGWAFVYFAPIALNAATRYESVQMTIVVLLFVAAETVPASAATPITTAVRSAITMRFLDFMSALLLSDIWRRVSVTFDRATPGCFTTINV